MIIKKQDLKLRKNHPSLLLSLPPEQTEWLSPLVINQEGVLIDGYRRVQIFSGQEMEAVVLETKEIYQAARQLNLRTRRWDEIDSFLWARWGRAEGVQVEDLFPVELWEAPEPVLRLLAERKLLPRQVVLIQQAPPAYRDFFVEYLSREIQLNVNETAAFIEMTIDLKKRLKKNRIQDVLLELGTPQSTRRKGEALLKELRRLRYPYLHKKAEEFSSNWRQLQLGRNVTVKKDLFLERGILEVTISSDSMEELKEDVRRLYDSLVSPYWEKIWNE